MMANRSAASGQCPPQSGTVRATDSTGVRRAPV
jgi:hypothetical protein